MSFHFREKNKYQYRISDDDLYLTEINESFFVEYNEKIKNVYFFLVNCKQVEFSKQFDQIDFVEFVNCKIDKIVFNNCKIGKIYFDKNEDIDKNDSQDFQDSEDFYESSQGSIWLMGSKIDSP